MPQNVRLNMLKQSITNSFIQTSSSNFLDIGEHQEFICVLSSKAGKIEDGKSRSSSRKKKRENNKTIRSRNSLTPKCLWPNKSQIERGKLKNRQELEDFFVISKSRLNFKEEKINTKTFSSLQMTLRLNSPKTSTNKPILGNPKKFRS